MSEGFSWGVAGTLFVVYVVVDFVYAAYILCVNRLQPVRAATFSSILYVMLAYGVINYSHNVLYLVPIGAGAWVGSWLLVTMEKRKAERLKVGSEKAASKEGVLR